MKESERGRNRRGKRWGGRKQDDGRSGDFRVGGFAGEQRRSDLAPAGRLFHPLLFLFHNPVLLPLQPETRPAPGQLSRMRQEVADDLPEMFLILPGCPVRGDRSSAGPSPHPGIRGKFPAADGAPYSRISAAHERAAATVGKPIVDVRRTSACRTSSGEAPASRALRAWLWTDPSERMAAAAASWINWADFSSRGPASFTACPSVSTASTTFPYRSLSLR